MYELAIGANAEHEEGIVKEIAKFVNEEASDMAESDSVWCQSQVLIETLEQNINDKSAFSKFLAIAKKVVKLLKLIARHPFLKKIVELVEMVIKFVDRQRKIWFKKVKQVTSHIGYTKGKIFFFPIIFFYDVLDLTE
jgi:hypothetical protein